MPDSIVIFYAPTWDAASQVSKHHMARYWAGRGKKVLFIEAPFHLLSLMTRPAEVKRLWRRFAGGEIKVLPNLWVTVAPIFFPYRAGLPLSGFVPFLALNQSIVKWKIGRLTRRLGISRPMVVVGSAISLPILESLNPSMILYHCSDDYTRNEAFPKSYITLEKKLSTKADLVICTAETLRVAKASLNKHTYAVTNGAQIEHFMRTQAQDISVANEIATLPKPVIGYIGTLFEWVDQEMLAFAAMQRPEWSFVLIGPKTVDISRLQRLPNVHILGPKPYDSLATYLKGFSVATIPFVIHDVTLRASPVKFYEYLASGVPIVATKLPDLEPFGDITSLIETKEEFLEALDNEVNGDTVEKRKARMERVKSHSWEAKFREIDRLVEQAFERQRNRDTSRLGTSIA